MNALRAITARVRALLALGDDVRLIGDVVLELGRRIDALEARVAEFDIAGAEIER